MNYAEIKEKTPVELAALGRDLRQELFMLRLQKASSQLEKTSRLPNLRHDIARVETRLSELRIAAAKAAQEKAATEKTAPASAPQTA